MIRPRPLTLFVQSFAAFSLGCSIAVAQVSETANTVNASSKIPSVQELRDMESRATRAIQKTLPAIVAVGNRFGRKPENVLWEGERLASGVIIREDGLILSQYHVSHTGLVDFENTGLRTYGKPGDTVDVILHDGCRLEAELLGGYQHADISLLKLKEPGPYPYLDFANNGSAVLGDWVIKLGHPLGFQPSRGAVARLGRVVYVNPVNLVADCMTSGGDSGGPIINLDAQIVGLVQNSDMPVEIAKVASDRGFAISYMTSAKIRGKLETMLASKIPHDTTFEDFYQRQRMYEETKNILGTAEARNGSVVRSSWKPIAESNKNSVVEVLGTDHKQVAYGTSITTDGWILTKASVVPEYPSCRLPNGEIVGARIVGTDRMLDLALLKVNAMGLAGVQWSKSEVDQVGALVMTMGSNSEPIAVGVVSTVVHTDPIYIERDHLVSGSYSRVFEHDMSLTTTQFGGPVFNLEGQAIGITMADAGLHGCLSVPAKDVVSCLERLRN